jgi:hypothetical protein
MNGRNYNDFKMATVRPEPVEGCLSLFAALINKQNKAAAVHLWQIGLRCNTCPGDTL